MDLTQFEIVEVLSPTDLNRRRAEYPRNEDYSAAMALPLESIVWDEEEVHPFKPAGKEPVKAKGPPPWAIGFSRQFKKDTAALDRKLMGRVLEVLAEVSDLPLPFEIRGDTFKPLKGELGGCWRYRLGEWRLLLRPDAAVARIDALALAARGSVYD